MVLRKRLDFGSRGHQVPATPRDPTLAQVKRSIRRKENELHALDLLATTAGMLSADQDNSSSRPNINGTAASYATNRKSVETEQLDEVLPFKSVAVEKDGCKGCTVGCAGVCGFLRQINICLAENSSTQNVADSVSDDEVLARTSVRVLEKEPVDLEEQPLSLIGAILSLRKDRTVVTSKKRPISDVGASSSPSRAKSVRITSRPPVAPKKTKPTSASTLASPRPLASVPAFPRSPARKGEGSSEESEEVSLQRVPRPKTSLALVPSLSEQRSGLTFTVHEDFTSLLSESSFEIDLDLPSDPERGQLIAQEQSSPPIVLVVEESSAEEILLVEGPPRTTEEVVLDVLATTAETFQEAPLDMEVQTERSPEEDRAEEVVHETNHSEEVVCETSHSEEVVQETIRSDEAIHETIETKDEDDHTLESQNTNIDPTREVFCLVQLDQPEDEIPSERSSLRTEKKNLQDLMISVKRCWKVNVDMVEGIKDFAEEKEKECLLAKAEQANAESALQALRLKLSEVEKRFEESAAKKNEEIRLLTQKNEKFQEILNRQSKESHDLFEQNKTLLKEKEELEKVKENLQKTSFNKDLQIQDLKEVERRGRLAIQDLEKNVETLMKASKEIIQVTGNKFSQISVSLREIADYLKAPVTPLATKMTLDDLRNDVYTQIKYIQKHIPSLKHTIYQSLTKAMSQALNRVLLKIDLLYGDSVDLQKLVPTPKFKTKEAGIAAQVRITPVVAEIIKSIEASVPALSSSTPGSSVQK